MNDEVKKKVQEQFSRNAQKYVDSETHSKGKDLITLLDWLQPSVAWKALDIATGGGHVTKAISPHVAYVVCTDLTKPMLSIARKHIYQDYNNVMYVVADAEELPFLEATFEAVVCRIAAHHFPNPEKFVSEVSRVLKPGGRFILIDNIAPVQKKLDKFVNIMEKLRDDSHGRCYTIAEWTQWFSKNGLVLRKSDIHKKKLDFPSWVQRTAQSDEQIKSVIDHIIQANQITKDYYSFEFAEGEIRSLKIDEWMVLLEKE